MNFGGLILQQNLEWEKSLLSELQTIRIYWNAFLQKWDMIPKFVVQYIK